ncbi:hypothetical protein HMPREF9080_01019 [Cardiobacterium valvarum F0432]|uniref:Uncharacterized protein n=1 Tax=Cardiobacterium valvarum F0432 TaxID=797473 RepID=G9ZE36_9GAMM|nr:hypothetical protein HMPREF9080_01019 [Cardiobacterium valvarum F0432]
MSKGGVAWCSWLVAWLHFTRHIDDFENLFWFFKRLWFSDR